MTTTDSAPRAEGVRWDLSPLCAYADDCRQRLASFKKPESVVFVAELPRNPMGKVLKRVLREQYGQPSGH